MLAEARGFRPCSMRGSSPGDHKRYGRAWSGCCCQRPPALGGDQMLRTLPLASDTKTVAVVRATPAKQPELRLNAHKECTPFPAAPEGGDNTVVDGDPHEDQTSAYRTGAIIAGKYRLMRQ